MQLAPTTARGDTTLAGAKGGGLSLEGGAWFRLARLVDDHTVRHRLLQPGKARASDLGPAELEFHQDQTRPLQSERKEEGTLARQWPSGSLGA